MTTATAPKIDIPAIVSKLKTRLAALGDGRDCKSENERITYRRHYDTVQGCISGLMNVPSDLAAEQPRLDDLEARRRAVIEKQTALETTIANFTDWRLQPDARLRDAEWEQQHQTRRALERLREGSLLKAPGVVFERLADLDARIAEERKRRDALQSALDAHLKQAEALLAAAAAG